MINVIHIHQNMFYLVWNVPFESYIMKSAANFRFNLSCSYYPLLFEELDK